ncbi:MAG: peptide chain release factor N(5)-glutamine methyltransferase [Candidatus Pelagibacter sp. TMED165]|nr:MAG: peptide chain release factor N(5)-glutamine methyltransferase [Candidatus Pelagibacter sp. TMED165]|tara:strand:+ start:1716 stop:2558 length:843 start_codon:yes stop_codon:yes gene_type:complete
MKLQYAIQKANKILREKAILSPSLDSELLMSKVINKERKFVILNLDKQINKKDYLYFKKLIFERAKGKPLAYLTGKKSFWNYEFEINENVLIPRPDTEIIIEEVLKIYKNKDNLNFLEIGVGSGCILLSILKEKKHFKAYGIDISLECLKASKTNANKLNVENRVKFFKSDIDNFNNGKYDLIISNPPYIKKLDLKYLEKDISNFEPKLALEGGLDGLSEIRKVIAKASELIKINGKLILEIAFNQKEEVKKILRDKGFYVNKVVKDLSKFDRCIISTKI